MKRRAFLGLALACAALPSAAALPGPTPAELLGATGDAYFTDWLNDYYARSLAAGVSKVVFDRGGNMYHGRVAAVADAARNAGLEF